MFKIFNVDYIFERDAYPCGPLIRVRRGEVWKKVGEANISVLFCSFYSPVSEGGVEKERRPLLVIKFYQHPGMKDEEGTVI